MRLELGGVHELEVLSQMVFSIEGSFLHCLLLTGKEDV